MRRGEHAADVPLVHVAREPDAPVKVRRRRTDLYAVASISDTRQEIVDLLCAHIDATDVLVLVKDDNVTLAGLVHRAIDRQIAEDLVWCMPEVSVCHNQLQLA